MLSSRVFVPTPGHASTLSRTWANSITLRNAAGHAPSFITIGKAMRSNYGFSLMMKTFPCPTIPMSSAFG